MKLTSREQEKAKRVGLRHLDAYTDAELETLGWVELSAICGKSAETIRSRVAGQGMTRREAMTRPYFAKPTDDPSTTT